MIPTRSSLTVEERLQRIQLADGHWGMLDPSTGIFTYEYPGPITFTEFTFHIDFTGSSDTSEVNPEGDEPDDVRGGGEHPHATAPEGDVPPIRDSLEPVYPSVGGSGTEI